MKKSVILTSLLAVMLMFNTAVYAEDSKTVQPAPEKAPITKTFPKLYDKDGNELKAPPKPGEAVYDKDGNKLPPPPCCKKPMPKGPELNLTDKQKAKADKIREESKKKMKPIRREIHNIKNEIWEIKEDDSLTMEQQQEKIVPLMKKIEDLRSQANAIRQEDMKQFEKILTKDQKKVLDEFKKTHKPPQKPCPIRHPHHMD
ncbi:MAG: Spy/CpxP family protein refolding chaperone [Candidatus Gastranaerophilales bacterium]|nr:Spy/CpxP family protein refolding chaperone [Candidatus Gastranaerophilales bacterium]